MTWTPALAIGGALLALGPIILHIIFRRRFIQLEWAAMRFLLDSMKRNRQRLRIEELIIIALRVLICAILGFMLANIRARSLMPTGAAPAAHVFVLDDSYSMGQQAATTVLFQKATEHLAEMLQNLPDGDWVAVLSACQPADGSLMPELRLAVDLKSKDFQGRLAAARPKDLSAHFPEALAEAQRLLENRKELIARLYLISDFRNREFNDEALADNLRKTFAALAALPAELTLFDYGEACEKNLTVEKLELVDKLTVARVKAQFQVAVRNNGTKAVEGAALTVEAGAAVLPAVMLPAIGPGEVVTRSFGYTFPEPGPAWVKVKLTPDSLEADNAAYLALDVRDALRVLIVDGSPSAANPATSSSFCLAHALDPTAKGAYGQKVDVTGLEDFATADLSRYDTVVLTNVKEFDTVTDLAGKVMCPRVKALEEFVRSGGGLAVFLGDRVNPSFYNGPLYADGSGLLPYKLRALPRETDRTRFVRFRPDSIAAEAMLRIFTGRGEKFTRLVRFYTYVRVEETAPPALAEGAGPAQVLARFDDQDASPALVRRALGRGQVMVWHTAADTRWSEWPKDLTFLPVMNDMVWQLARPAAGSFGGLVGEPIAYELPESLLSALAITMKTPSYPAEDLQSLQARVEGKSKRVLSPPTRRAGLYEVQFTLPDRSKQTVYFSRRVDPREGDLDKAGEEKIANAVGKTHNYRGGLAAQGAPVAQQAASKAYWWAFMVLVLVFLCLELFLAQRFGHYAAAPVSASPTT